MVKRLIYLVILLGSCMSIYDPSFDISINVSNILCVVGLINLVLGLLLLVVNMNFFTLSNYTIKRFIYTLRYKKPYMPYEAYCKEMHKFKHVSVYILGGVMLLLIAILVV